MTEKTQPRRRYGGFDALRIAAALGVVLYHSFPLTGHDSSLPALWVGHYRLPLGSIAVAVFFVTSGFLVAESWDRLGRWSTFVWHRFARIWPALTLVIVLTVFVLGPAVTTLSAGAYFSSRQTVLYLARGVTLFGGTIDHLPGVFTTNPRHVVNGSIWTLTYEVWAYAGLLALGVLGGLRRAWVTVTLFFTVLLVFRFAVYGGVGNLPVNSTVLTLSLGKGAELGAYFLAGTAISRFAGRVDLRRLIVPGAVGVALALVVGEPLVFIPSGALLIIGLGACNSRVIDAIHRRGDPSYGIYILSFPIQQVLYWSGAARTPAPMFVASAALSIAAGYLSWHALEAPVLRRARRRTTAERLASV